MKKLENTGNKVKTRESRKMRKKQKKKEKKPGATVKMTEARAKR